MPQKAGPSKRNIFLDLEAQRDESENEWEGEDYETIDTTVSEDEHEDNHTRLSRSGQCPPEPPLSQSLDAFTEYLQHKYVEKTQVDVQHGRPAGAHFHPSTLSRSPNKVHARHKRRTKEISTAQWVRISQGLYKGDVAFVTQVDKESRYIEVCLLPRIQNPLSKEAGRPSPAVLTDQSLDTLKAAGIPFRQGQDDTVQVRWLRSNGEYVDRTFKKGWELLWINHYKPSIPTIAEFNTFYLYGSPVVFTEGYQSSLESTALELTPVLNNGDRCEIHAGQHNGLRGYVQPSDLVSDEYLIRLFDDSTTIQTTRTHVRRLFAAGDEVDIVMGAHTGKHGWVLDTREVSVHVYIETTDQSVEVHPHFLTFRWASGQGPLPPPTKPLRVSPQITVLDRASVTVGPYQGREGTVVQLFDRGMTSLLRLDGSNEVVSVWTKHLQRLRAIVDPVETPNGPLRSSLDKTSSLHLRFRGWSVLVSGNHPYKGWRASIREVKDNADVEVELAGVLPGTSTVVDIPMMHLSVYCSKRERYIRLAEIWTHPSQRFVFVPGADPSTLLPPVRSRTPPTSNQVEWTRSPAHSPALPEFTFQQNSCTYPETPPSLAKEARSLLEAPWFNELVLSTPNILVRVSSGYHVDIPMRNINNVWRVERKISSEQMEVRLCASGVETIWKEWRQTLPLRHLFPLHPSDVQTPFQTLVVDKTHQWFGRIVRIVNNAETPSGFFSVSPPVGKDKRKVVVVSNEQLVVYGHL